MSALRRFVLALQFLTVITVWPRLRPQGRDLAGSMLYYPLVGLILGAGLCGARWLFSFWPPVLIDALLVVLMVIFSRGLHLEGLADAADGLGGGQGREGALKIMKDSAAGPFGVMAVGLVLLVKFAALMAIPAGLKYQALLLMPLAGRLSMIVLCLTSPSARSGEGLAGPFLAEMKAGEVIAAGIFALAAGVLLLGSAGGMIVLGAAGLALLARFYLIRRLGGISGDLIGAVGELAEVGVLLALAATMAG